eukprot:6196671-Pleurochrysis_carterae.AAC.2
MGSARQISNWNNASSMSPMTSDTGQTHCKKLFAAGTAGGYQSAAAIPRSSKHQVCSCREKSAGLRRDFDNTHCSSTGATFLYDWHAHACYAAGEST